MDGALVTQPSEITLLAKCSGQHSLETNFFRIAGTSKAETSVSGKAECLLAMGEDKS